MSSSFGLINLIFVMLGGLSGGGLPLGFPPAPHDPLIDHVAPSDCLVYVAWNGTASASPDSVSRTEQLLADPEVERFTTLLIDRISTSIRKHPLLPGDARQISIQLFDLIRVLTTRPTAIYIGTPNPLPSVGLVCRVGDQGSKVEAWLASLESAITENAGVVAVQDGRNVHHWPLGPLDVELQWAVVDDCLLLAFGPNEFDKLVKRRQAKETPDWLASLHDRLNVERLANIIHVDTAAILKNAAPILQREPQANAMIQALGLDSVLSFSCVTGLENADCVSRTWIRTSGPAKGLFKLVDVKPLQVQEFNVVPADANITVAFRLDLQKTIQKILDIADDIEPGASRHARHELDVFQSMFGLNLEDEVLSAIGDSWRIYQSESEGGPWFTGWTGVVSVRDANKLRNVSNLFRGFVAAQNAQHRSSRQLRIQTFSVGKNEIFFANLGDENVPLAPAWCVTDDELVISLLPQGVTAWLNRDEKTPRLAQASDISEHFPENCIGTIQYNEKKVFNAAYPLFLMGANMFLAEMQQRFLDIDISILPSAPSVTRHLSTASTSVLHTNDGLEIVSRRTLPIGLESLAATASVALLLETRSFNSTRRSDDLFSILGRILSPTTARRDTSKNNLKQLMLAFHNFHDVHGRFPAALTTAKDGKAGLSWRVQLLPFLEHSGLFNEFRQDEPWDSEHNRTLIAKMPDVFRSPGSSADEFKTNYVGLRIKNSMLPPEDKGVGMRDITDGTSNTIMLVEADDEHAVIWTKPDDLDFDLENPLTGLNSPSISGGFLAAFADGSVRFISTTIDLEILRNLVIRNDGNVIGEF